MKLTIKPITERTWQIVIPTKDNSGYPIRRDVFNKYIESLSSHFGGVTITDGYGCYVDNNKKLVCEPNKVVLASRDFQNPYDESPDIIKFKTLCNTEDKMKTDECIRLANSILKRDVEFMKNFAKQVGNELGQETIFVFEDIVQDVSFIKGRKKESLLDENKSIPLPI